MWEREEEEEEDQGEDSMGRKERHDRANVRVCVWGGGGCSQPVSVAV